MESTVFDVMLIVLVAAGLIISFLKDRSQKEHLELLRHDLSTPSTLPTKHKQPHRQQ